MEKARVLLRVYPKKWRRRIVLQCRPYEGPLNDPDSAIDPKSRFYFYSERWRLSAGKRGRRPEMATEWHLNRKALIDAGRYIAAWR